ncbi:MAG TPA: tetratricopeptide repeat protein [Pyrinomonadaceae bacterium]|jgi:tetratricopeptide (TPR) repeat protein|nr:tetratricopeptide repeat protein [Pyrinomonadaceae bacterium]
MSERIFLAALLAASCLLSAACSSAGGASPAADVLLQPLPAESERPTAADRQLRAARAAVEREPKLAKGYNLLAAALMQKAREAEDFHINARAMEALDRSLRVAPDNYDALKLRAKLLLTFHRFEEALEVARRAAQLNPRDHDNYGALTDALVELGEYPAAVEAAQRMVDLRPDTSSYARVSYLRWLHGDADGAIDAMRLAAQAASPKDPERVAWCHVQLGDALLNKGKTAEAEREFERALYVFPGYGAALGAKARARVAAGDPEGALAIYAREYEGEPSADTALALGDLHAKLGRAEEAEKFYKSFKTLERENAEAENDWHHFVHFWTDHDRNLDEALALARKERDRRKDIYTCDALAWALYKKGQYAEAKAAMDEALRLKTRDPRLLYHAGMIANALGDRRAAGDYLKAALELNPSFDVLHAEAARRALREVNG